MKENIFNIFVSFEEILFAKRSNESQAIYIR